jgi:hypothetical protein
VAGAWQERVIKAIREGVEPILAVRTLEEERRDEWYGVVLTYTNPGLSTLEFYVEWLDTYLAVGFHAPGFDSSKPVPTAPAFALWQVLRARNEPHDGFGGALSSWEYEEVSSYMKRVVDEILETCLPILDGDFSLAPLIREQASTNPLQSL